MSGPDDTDQAPAMPDGPAEDEVRVLRVLEYRGPRSVVEATIARSIQGSLLCGPERQLRITATTLDCFPEVLVRARQQPHVRQPAPAASNDDQAPNSHSHRATPFDLSICEVCGRANGRHFLGCASSANAPR